MNRIAVGLFAAHVLGTPTITVDKKPAKHNTNILFQFDVFILLSFQLTQIVNFQQ